MIERSYLIRNCAIAATLALAAGGCIKREPLAVDAKTAADTGEEKSTEDEAQANTLAETGPPEPTGNWGKVEGVDVLEGKGVEAFSLSGDTDKVKLSGVRVKGQDFERALSADIRKPSEKAWDVQLTATVPVEVERGDVLLASFYVRADKLRVKTGDAVSEFVFELNEDPWTKSATHALQVGEQWTKILVPFKAEADYPPGKAQIGFRLGYDPQRIELGGLEVKNYGKELTLADLPTTPVTYAGMAADSEWRGAAAERIEKHRQADLEVVVQDGQGKPVADAEVAVELERSAFVFGTQAPASKILGGDGKYQEALERFNLAALEHDLEWPPLAGDWGESFTLERAQKAIESLKTRGIEARGDVLVKPGWRNLPEFLGQHRDDPARLRSEIKKHITDLVSHFKGQVAHWDVVSEPYDNHELLELLGEEVMVDWFKQAHAADPEAKLYINDYRMLTGGGGTNPHRDYFEQTVRMLVDAEAPLDGISLQGRFGSTLTTPVELLRLLDRFAQLNKPILVTAFDVSALKPELSAQYFEDFYRVLFSHPAVEGIILSGFWDGAHYMNDAPLYHDDWSEKPAHEVFQKLVGDEWKTEENGKTDEDGTYRVRGFLGDYVVRVMSGDREVESRGKLVRGGSRLVVEL